MLVLFSTTNPAYPDKPAVDRLINSRHVVDVEPVYSGGEDGGQPAGSILTMTTKVKHRVDANPREVLRQFQINGGGR